MHDELLVHELLYGQLVGNLVARLLTP